MVKADNVTMDIELDRTINATKTLDFIRYSRNLTYIYATILLFVYVLIFAKDVSMQLLSNNVQAQVNAVIFFEWWISILAPISLIGILTIILFTLMSSNIIKHILFNKANDRKQNSSSHLWGWFVPVASIWIVPKSLSIGEKGKDSLSSKSRIIRFLLIFAHVAPLVVIIGFSIIGILMGSISHVEFMIFNALIGLVVGMVIASSFYILGYYYSCVFKVLVNNEEGYDLDYKKRVS